MVAGTKDDAQALEEEIAGILSTLGLRLSPEKTLITHIDEGLDFLGWRIQRHRKRGKQPTVRLYLLVTQSRQGRNGQGQDHLPDDRHEPAARRPPAPA
jgi:RNA-directed DNA polymerase